MRFFARLGVVCMLAGMPFFALADQADQVTVSEPKLRVMPGTSPGAGYLQLDNTGEHVAVLRATGTDAYGRGEIHESLEVDGVYRMEEREAIRLAPGEGHTFRPGGYHLMFMQRQAELAVGDTVPVWLEFEDSSRLIVDFEVVPPTYH